MSSHQLGGHTSGVKEDMAVLLENNVSPIGLQATSFIHVPCVASVQDSEAVWGPV